MEQIDNPIPSLMDDLESILGNNNRNDVSEARTLELLQNTQLVSAKAQSDVKEALNDNGANVKACARMLSFIILDAQTKPDVRRRAIIDALTLHGAMPDKTDAGNRQAIQIVVQSSPHINLGAIFNPTNTRTLNATGS